MGESKEVRPEEGETPTSAHAMGDWSQAGGFFSSILSGLVLGLAGDYFLNTEPWLVVGGIIAGFAVGFWRMIVFSNRIMDQASNPRLQRIARMRAATEVEDEEDDL
jgi:F0F1-type ATP synthase assembly protein I